MLVAEASGGSIGDLLPKFVYPSDVEELKRQIDPSVIATDAAVTACTNLDPATRAAWQGFRAAWGLFRAQKTPLLFGSANLYDEGVVFQAQLAQWQAQLREKCAIPGPAVVDPHANDAEQASLLKWAAAAVITVAVVWGVRSVVKSV